MNSCIVVRISANRLRVLDLDASVHHRTNCLVHLAHGVQHLVELLREFRCTCGHRAFQLCDGLRQRRLLVSTNVVEEFRGTLPRRSHLVDQYVNLQRCVALDCCNHLVMQPDARLVGFAKFKQEIEHSLVLARLASCFVLEAQRDDRGQSEQILVRGERVALPEHALGLRNFVGNLEEHREVVKDVKCHFLDLGDLLDQLCWVCGLATHAEKHPVRSRATHLSKRLFDQIRDQNHVFRDGVQSCSDAL